MAAPRRTRARDVAAGRPLVTADLASVTRHTGLATDIETGPSPFSAPPVAILDPDGSLLLVVSEDEAPGADDGVEVRTFPGFALDDVDRPGEAGRLVLEALGRPAVVAANLASLPGGVAAALAHAGAELIDVSGALQLARAVKDPDELDAIRAAVAIADTGQAAARDALGPGQTELDLFAAVRAAMERTAGERVPLLADCVSGERTADVGGPPLPRAIGAGEPVIVDLVPRLGAYWADSCATLVAGEPAAALRRLHDAARRALDAAIAAVRPGARAGELERVARAAVEDAGGSYPHHTGHGFGVTTHEEPRIIPGSRRTLEPGMVVALEPGSYGNGFGLRVEWLVEVTDDGSRLLSGHDLAL